MQRVFGQLHQSQTLNMAVMRRSNSLEYVESLVEAVDFLPKKAEGHWQRLDVDRGGALQPRERCVFLLVHRIEKTLVSKFSHRN